MSRLRLRTPPARTALSVAALTVLSLAVLPRAAMMQHAPAFILPHDTADFFGAGYSHARGGELTLPFKRAPLYAYFLSANVVTFGPDLEAIVRIQHLLGLLTVAATLALGVLIAGRAGAVVAAGLVAVNGSLLLMEHTVAAEALYTPFLVGAALLILGSARTGWFWSWLLVGLALGLGALARPITQAIVPLALLVIILQPRGLSWRAAAAGLVCIGFVAAVGPWLIRNHVVHGIWSVSGGLGDSLFARTNRHDRSFDYVDLAERDPDRQRARMRKRAFELAQKNSSGSNVREELIEEFGITEAQSDAVLKDASLQVIRQEPVRFASGTVEMFRALALDFSDAFGPLWETRARPKFAAAWPADIRFAMEPAVARPAESRALVEWLTGLYQDREHQLLVTVLFVLGTIGSLRSPWRHGLFIVPILVLGQLLLYVAINGYTTDDDFNSRYRYPLQPFITLLCVYGAVTAPRLAASVLRGARLRAPLAGLPLDGTPARGTEPSR